MKDIQTELIAKIISPTTTDASLRKALGVLEKETDNTKSSSSPLIKNFVEDYIQEKANSGCWGTKTINDYKAVFKLFIEVYGESSIDSISRKDMVHYRDEILRKLPINRNKGAIAKMSLKILLEDNSMKTLSIKRINNSLSAISCFFNWCMLLEYISVNPASGLKIKDREISHQKRDIYNDAELKQIAIELSKLPMTPAKKVMNTERFWIILIGMFQGFRANEICQLAINDIVSVNGISCFSLGAGGMKGQSFKSASSLRTVPIHETLLKMGFLDYVNQRRSLMNKAQKSSNLSAEQGERHKQLFSTMNLSHSRETFTRNFYNFYRNFNRKVTNNPKCTFHSLRHNFVTRLNNSSQAPYAVCYLSGHTFKTETAMTYTKPDMSALKSELSRLDFGFNLFEIFDIEPLPDQVITEQQAELPVCES
jgi:integrase